MNRMQVIGGVAAGMLMAGCQPPDVEVAAEESKGRDLAKPAAEEPVAEETPAPADPPAAGGATEEWIECRPGGEARWEIVAGEGSKWIEEEGVLRIPWANSLGAVRWTGAVPEAPFEIELEAQRTDGSDFFCGLTVPTRSTDECVTLIVGGWGGSIVGISCINDLDASENQSALDMRFEDNQWYKIRLRFAGERLMAWIDDKEIIDVDTTGTRLSLRPGAIELCAPVGLATWECGGEMRGIRWRRLPKGE